MIKFNNYSSFGLRAAKNFNFHASIIFLALFVSFHISLFAQEKRETRAVWVATNFQLDWPPRTYNENEQKFNLSAIISNINSKKLNTIYFQVRSSGTVMYNSSYEPFSPYLTGITGGRPNYDPLKLAVKLAHKKGLELHAWLNIMRCFSGSENEITKNQEHIVNKHPEWLVTFSQNGKSSIWLDPGLPEVRNYLVKLIAELARNYDVDGIHLDFIRYPGNNFDDDFSYNLYGNGKDKAEWRRENISKFISQLYTAIKIIKPFIKLGVTPFGIYKNLKNATGTEGYSNVFQDTRQWLSSGYIDYAVPQIYWNLNDNPRFDVLAKDWTNNSFNKNIILGIAAYKPEVKSELDKIITYSRSVNASGIAFFRYGNIKDYKFNLFQNRAFPAAHPDAIDGKPLPPTDLQAVVEPTSFNKIILKWDLPKDNRKYGAASYYALYKLKSAKDTLAGENLYDIFEADKNSIALSIYSPSQIKYYFTLKSVDKAWNESEKSSNIVEITLPAFSIIRKQMKIFDKPILIKNIDNSFNLLIFANHADSIIVSALRESLKTKLLSAQIFPGKNILTIENILTNYTYLKIKYLNSGKEVKLEF